MSDRAAADRPGRSSSRGRTTTATRSSRSSASAPTRRASGTPTTSSRADTAAVVLPGGFSYGDYLRCGAIARFSPIMRAVAALRRRGRPRARHLQRLPDPDRGRPASRARSARTSRSRSCAATSPLTVERTDTPFTVAVRARPGAHDPGEARRRLLVRRRRSCSRELERERPDRRSATRPGANPNGAVADVAGVLQRRRQRVRADAAPGARGRPAARLDRRRADPRLARRRGSVVARGARLGRPPGRAPPRARASSRAQLRSRSRSRARSVTGPRRADAVGRVREAHEALASLRSRAARRPS